MASEPRDRPRHRALRDPLDAGRRQALLRAAEAALDRRLAESAEFAAAFEAREQSALLALATVHGNTVTRARLRSMARAVCRNAFVRRFRSDAAYWEPFHVVGREHLRVPDGGPGLVFAVFHFGDYRLSAPLLVDLGFRLVWLADPENTVRVRSQLTEGRIGDYLPAGDDDAGLTVERFAASVQTVDATSAASVWQIIKSLRSGTSAVVFPDGNSGDRDDPGPNSIPLSFLGKPILARAGAAMMAYAAGTAVVPMFFFERDGQPAVRVLEPIRPHAGESVRQFGARGTRELFGLLERRILEEPCAWEEWHNLCRWIEVSKLTRPSAEPRALAIAADDRLAVDDRLWWIDVGGCPHAIDTAALCSVGSHPEIGRIVAHAERGSTVREWLDEAPDVEESLALLQQLCALALVHVDRRCGAPAARGGSLEVEP
jgi:lauroyl/myristoyl acyltransferase